jgi:hypothetical protein
MCALSPANSSGRIEQHAVLMITDHRHSLMGGDNVDGQASTAHLEFYKASLKYGKARKDAQL